MRLLTDVATPLYVAVDPGLVTGVAVYSQERFNSIEVAGGDIEFGKFFRELLADYTVTQVVCETFTITPQSASKTRQYDALYIIGWLRSELPHLGIPLAMQTPSTAKGFGTDLKLRHMGWSDRTPGGHRNDAARHMLTFLAKAKEPYVLKRLEEML